MRYVIRVGDGHWLAAIDRGSDDEFTLTGDRETAAVFTDPVEAARTVGRVSTSSPLVNPRGSGPGELNAPLLRAGARVERLDEAREENHG